MNLRRIGHAAINRAGALVTRVVPPNVQEFEGTGNVVSEVCLVALRYEYGSSFGLAGYEYRHFLPALRRLAKRVWFVPIEARQRIPELVRRLPRGTSTLPVISVYQKSADLSSEYFALRNDNCVLINWYTDDDMQFERFSRTVALSFDWNVTTYPPNAAKYAAIGSRVLVSQWAGLDGLTFNSHRTRIAAFVGRMYGSRLALARLLQKQFGDLVYIHDSRLRPISQEMMMARYGESVCAIDEPTSFRGATRQIKGRVFENASMGNAILTKPNIELESYFEPNKEIIYYEDYADLARILEECITNPTRFLEIGRAAYERVKREHSYDQRFRAILIGAGVVHGA